MCGVWGTFSCAGFLRKSVLNPFTISNISGSFVSISHTSKNNLTFLLAASLELFLQRRSCLPTDEHSSDLLWELYIEKTCWRKLPWRSLMFPLCSSMFLSFMFQLLGGSFGRIFLLRFPISFFWGRISNAVLQNSSSVSVKGYSEITFVFSFPFQQIFWWPVFFI